MKVEKISLSDIYRYDNSRAEGSDLSELMLSIKELGTLQPIVVAPNFMPNSNKKYILCCGNRRFMANKNLGETEILAVINPKIKDEKELIIINLSENIQRKDVSGFEQGRFIHKLTTIHALTHKECAARLGVTVKLITDLLQAFNQTPKEFQDKIVHGDRHTKKGFISLCSVVTINNMRKGNLIDANGQRKLLSAASKKIYTNTNLKDFAKELKKGAGKKDLNHVIDNRKPTVTIHSNTVVYISEKDKLMKGEESLTILVEKILYGETNKKFNRPRT